MLLGHFMKKATVQGNICLTLWRNDEVVNELRIEGTEDMSGTPGLGLWQNLEIKYIFAATDGFLHIDFEVRG